MLQFLNLSATLAAVVITQVNSIILPSVAKDAANESVQASTQVVRKTDKANTDVASASTVILRADSGNDSWEVTKRVDTAWILGLAALGGGAVVVALSARNAKKPFHLSTTPFPFSPKSSPASHESTIRIEQASRQLQKKLLRLLHDERDTANRLLSQAKLKNPNRSVNWYMEKVIYDLERDRGGY